MLTPYPAASWNLCISAHSFWGSLWGFPHRGPTQSQGTPGERINTVCSGVSVKGVLGALSPEAVKRRLPGWAGGRHAPRCGGGTEGGGRTSPPPPWAGTPSSSAPGPRSAWFSGLWTPAETQAARSPGARAFRRGVRGASRGGRGQLAGWDSVSPTPRRLQ